MRAFASLLIAYLAMAAVSRAAPEASAACVSHAIGVDISHSEGTIGSIFGQSVGQTFLAADTLIRSISVWKTQPACSCTAPVRLWVTHTDSTGKPLVHRPEHVVLKGPVARVIGDSVTRAPVRVQYRFDPPLRLPRPGLYALFAQDYCSVSYQAHVNRTGNLYPDGRLWRTTRSEGTGLPDCAIVGVFGWGYELYDMIFEVEFCRDVTTSSQKKTWGKLKTTYR